MDQNVNTTTVVAVGGNTKPDINSPEEENNVAIPQATIPKVSANLVSKVYDMKEVAMHNTPQDMWLVVNNDIYDVTGFQHEHPGGSKSRWQSLQYSAV